jgi:chemotaxis protein MotB
MIMRKINFFQLLLGLTILSFSCVPARKFQDLESQHKKLTEDMEFLKKENADLSSRNTEMASKLEDDIKRLTALISDTTFTGQNLRKITQQYNDVNKLNDELLSKYSALLKGNESETKKLIAELQETQSNLLQREDEMKILARDLQDREKKVNELERLINKKDSIVTALKNSVSEALIGFKDSGLSVEQKNGKVYVSLESQLLFPSGSTEVDSKGKKALLNLAKVLQQNKDINILIEGHTDIDKLMSGSPYKDNWDLSVMRSTQVVRILTGEGKLESTRVTASGRGEYSPVDAANTAEAKKKNRRIEIILSPKLDELYQLLNTNF